MEPSPLGKFNGLVRLVQLLNVAFVVQLTRLVPLIEFWSRALSGSTRAATANDPLAALIYTGMD